MKKENLKVLILIGIPASGKSTWAKDFLRNNANWIRVNRDYYRLMLREEQMCEPKVEGMVSELLNAAVTSALSKRMNVIIDNTNLKVSYINEFIEKFKYSADIEYRVFDISLDKAIDRDLNRNQKVGKDVIEMMHKNYKILIDSFGFQPVKKIAQRPHIKPVFESILPNAVIFDVDGTIALMTNRGPFDWHKVYKDDVNPIVAEHIAFHQSLGRKIIVVSGGDGSCRKQTEEWLDLYSLHFDELHMRPDGDYRKDTVIKKEIYNNEIKPRYNVLCVYDDRLQVLDMWNKLGVFTFNVNQYNQEY